MNCNMPGFPVHHQLLELTQTHVHQVGNAIQPSSSVVPFSSRLQFFQASGSFNMSQIFGSGVQSIGVSASASVLPMNILNFFPLGWTGWICLQSKGLSRVFSNTTVQTHSFFGWKVRLCPFCNILLLTQFSYIQCRRGCTRPWTPGGKGHWCHFEGWLTHRVSICLSDNLFIILDFFYIRTGFYCIDF